MAFQVLRIEKLKSAARLSGRIRHAMRDRIPAHADPNPPEPNSYVGYDEGGESVPLTDVPADKRTDMAMARFRSLLPAKFRKDAVQAIEVLVTASPEALNSKTVADQNKYLLAAFNWVTERFGGRQNLIGWAIHRDETTPHLSLFLVPRIVKDSKISLSAKAYIDGPKALSDLQTAFHEGVAKRFQLERGRRFSPATHMSVHEYYALTNAVARQKNLEREQKKLQKREEKQLKKGEGMGL